MDDTHQDHASRDLRLATALDSAWVTYRRELSGTHPPEDPAPAPSAIRYAQARTLVMLARWDEAIAIYLDLLQFQTPQLGTGTRRLLLRALVRAALRGQQAGMVADQLGALYVADPAGQADLPVWQGHLLQRGQRTAEAVAVLLTALPRLPADPLLRFTARMEALQALLAEGKLEQALELCRIGQAELPDYRAQLLASRSGVLLLAGRPAEALAEVEQSLALAPQLAEAWLNRGIALLRLGRREEARAALEQAVTWQPGLAPQCAQLLAADAP